MTVRPTIYIVDDDPGIRDALSISLELSGYCVSTFATGMSFLATCSDFVSGCLLLDVRIPDIDGLDLLDELNKRAIDLPTIIMTGHADVPMAVRAMKAGAVDFIEKPFSGDEIIECVTSALANHSAGQVSNTRSVAVDAMIANLTPREKEVMDHLVVGKPSKLIAFDLGISVRTVDIHRAQVMRKMNAGNVAELVRLTMGAGIG